MTLFYHILQPIRPYYHLINDSFDTLYETDTRNVLYKVGITLEELLPARLLLFGHQFWIGASIEFYKLKDGTLPCFPTNRIKSDYYGINIRLCQGYF